MTNTNTDKVIARIKALRAKTTDRGATEAEALAAAEMASHLMTQHEIDEIELVRSGEEATLSIDAEDYTDNVGKKTKPPVWDCSRQIGILTRTRMVTLTGERIIIVGEKADREFARFLLDMISTAIETEYVAYAGSLTEKKTRSTRSSFVGGMTIRINERLKELIAARDVIINNQASTEGGALVLVDDKKAKVDQLHAEMFPKLKKPRSGIVARDPAAFEAGMEAGDRVTLGNQLDDQSSQPMTLPALT